MIINNENEIYEDYRICPKCGAKVLSNNKFCTKCGCKMEYASREQSRAGDSDSALRRDDDIAQDSSTVDCRANSAYQKTEANMQDEPVRENIKNGKTSKASKIAIVVLSVMLVAAIGEGIYLYSTVQHLHKSFNGMEAMRDTANAKVDELQEKLDGYDELQQELASTQEELDNTKTQLEASKKKVTQLSSKSSQYSTKANNYDQICTFLKSDDAGGKTNKYYADEKIVVLKKTDGRYKLPIYFKYNVATTVTFNQNGYSAYCQWQPGDFETKTHLYIDPSYEGITTVTFTNSSNSDRFRVMIVVTE